MSKKLKPTKRNPHYAFYQSLSSLYLQLENLNSETKQDVINTKYGNLKDMLNLLQVNIDDFLNYVEAVYGYSSEFIRD